jgi:hypothetical protein
MEWEIVFCQGESHRIVASLIFFIFGAFVLLLERLTPRWYDGSTNLRKPFIVFREKINCKLLHK